LNLPANYYGGGSGSEGFFESQGTAQLTDKASCTPRGITFDWWAFGLWYQSSPLRWCYIFNRGLSNYTSLSIRDCGWQSYTGNLKCP